MSKACFGIEQSFVTRSKKSELDTKSNENVLFVDDLEDDPELDENGEASELSEGALKVCLNIVGGTVFIVGILFLARNDFTN